jgi:hypothetical protein
MNIIDLINKYNSDKGYQHGYSNIYFNFFEKLKLKKLNFLEIGIGTGESVNVWCDYFINSKIYMADIDDYSNIYKRDNLKILTVDQSDSNSLKKLSIDIENNLDIIIDDGGHAMDHQQLSLGILFEKLNNNGLYFIEDLHTSNWNVDSFLYNQSLKISKDRKNTTLNVLKEFKINGEFKSPFLEDSQNKYLSENIKSIDFYCNDKLCLLIKK